MWNQVGLRKHHHVQSYCRWWTSSWAISNPKRWCCESAALNISANLGESAVATGLEKVNFLSNPKERQCQGMFKLLHNVSICLSVYLYMQVRICKYLYIFNNICLCWVLTWSKGIHLQCGKPGFNPWVGKNLWRGVQTTDSSILAWRIPMDRDAWWATVHGVTNSRTQMSN